MKPDISEPGCIGWAVGILEAGIREAVELLAEAAAGIREAEAVPVTAEDMVGS